MEIKAVTILVGLQVCASQIMLTNGCVLDVLSFLSNLHYDPLFARLSFLKMVELHLFSPRW